MNTELDDICDTPGIVHRAPRVLIYGASGQGKSTLASRFPAPLFLDTEKGTLRLDLRARKFIESWDALMSTLKAVETRRPASIATVVIDTVDWLIDFATKQVCAEKKVKSIEEIQYKAGYTFVHDKVQTLLDQLTRLNDMGYGILLIAHARDEVLKLPGLDPFRTWNLKIVGTASQSKQTAEKIREWVDEVYFLDKDVKVDKGIATGGQFRVLYTQATPSIIAKSRYGISAENPCILQDSTLSPIYEAIESAHQAIAPAAAPALAPAPAPAPAPGIMNTLGFMLAQAPAPAAAVPPPDDPTGFTVAGLDPAFAPYAPQLLEYVRRMNAITPEQTLANLPDKWRNRMNGNPAKVIEVVTKEVAA